MVIMSRSQEKLQVVADEISTKIYYGDENVKATTNCIVVSRPGCRFNSMQAGGQFLLPDVV